MKLYPCDPFVNFEKHLWEVTGKPQHYHWRITPPGHVPTMASAELLLNPGFKSMCYTNTHTVSGTIEEAS